MWFSCQIQKFNGICATASEYLCLSAASFCAFECYFLIMIINEQITNYHTMVSALMNYDQCLEIDKNLLLLFLTVSTTIF